MKIRADFVTNSSSSSFVSITLHMKDGTTLSAEYGGDNMNTIADEEFKPSKKYFESLNSCEELINDAIEWFCASLAGPMSEEEVLEIFGQEETTAAIRGAILEDVKKIETNSLVDYEEYAMGSDITYNLETKKRTRKNTGYGFDG